MKIFNHATNLIIPNEINWTTTAFYCLSKTVDDTIMIETGTGSLEAISFYDTRTTEESILNIWKKLDRSSIVLIGSVIQVTQGKYKTFRIILRLKIWYHSHARIPSLASCIHTIRTSNEFLERIPFSSIMNKITPFTSQVNARFPSNI